MKRLSLLMLSLSIVTGCSTLDRVFPDTRTEYKKSESLPDLEIPPDLTADAINDRMSLPSERGSVAPLSNSAGNPGEENSEQQKRAEIQDVGDNKKLLSIPDEYTVVWNEIENLLTGAGIQIDKKDQSKGIYTIIYIDDSATKDKGWLSKLTFWSSGKQTYLISLTGVGDKTELAVLNTDGEWETSVDVDRILSKIHTQYNISHSGN